MTASRRLFVRPGTTPGDDVLELDAANIPEDSRAGGLRR
jgi:hypothetical protein